MPCKEQTRGWSEEDKIQYAEVLHCTDKIVYAAKRYFNDCMQKRNRHMVGNSQYCVCYLKKNTGGIAYAVYYAEQKQLKMIYVE